MEIAWLMSIWAYPVTQVLMWALLAGFVGFFAGLGEILGAFKNETGRAMRTGGAWLLVLFNFAGAAIAFILASSVIPGANSWATAIIMGLAWPTLIRNITFKLGQPLQTGTETDNFSIRFDQAYAAVQALALQLINATLTRQRMKPVTQAMSLDLAELEKQARLAVIASPLTAPEGGPPSEYIDRVMARDVEDDIKKALLATFILQFFDRYMLDELLKDKKKK